MASKKPLPPAPLARHSAGMDGKPLSAKRKRVKPKAKPAETLRAEQFGGEWDVAWLKHQASDTSGAEPLPPPNQVYPTFAIIDALTATMGKVYLAAKRLGCDPDTIYERAKKEPAIELAIRMARGEGVDRAELVVTTSLNSKDPRVALDAAKFVLKTLGKDRGYVERQELGGPDGGAIPVGVVVEVVVRTREEAKDVLSNLKEK